MASIRVTKEAHTILNPLKKRLGADSVMQLASDLILEAAKTATIREKLQRLYNVPNLDGMLK